MEVCKEEENRDSYSFSIRRRLEAVYLMLLAIEHVRLLYVGSKIRARRWSPR
jgi:hypothetical protein